MQDTATRRSFAKKALHALPTLLVLATALGVCSPKRASADSPAAIRAATTTVLALRAGLGIAKLPRSQVFQLAPTPAKTGFVSDDLLKTATDLVKNGVRVHEGLAGGTLYVHFKPQGFGGVLSVRYRR